MRRTHGVVARPTAASTAGLRSSLQATRGETAHAAVPDAGMRKVKRRRRSSRAASGGRPRRPRQLPAAAAIARLLNAAAATSASRCRTGQAFSRLHIQLHDVFGDAALRAVRAELSSLHRTFKETDLFKVWQIHLGNLDRDATPQVVLPARSSCATRCTRPPSARSSAAPGCAPLTGQTDCSCNVRARRPPAVPRHGFARGASRTSSTSAGRGGSGSRRSAARSSSTPATPTAAAAGAVGVRAARVWVDGALRRPARPPFHAV